MIVRCLFRNSDPDLEIFPKRSPFKREGNVKHLVSGLTRLRIAPSSGIRGKAPPHYTGASFLHAVAYPCIPGIHSPQEYPVRQVLRQDWCRVPCKSIQKNRILWWSARTLAGG